MRFNFNNFYSKYIKEYPGLVCPSPEFLTWLIGFTEGDGSFTITKRGDLSFVVTQSSEDVNVLNYIKENLGFGSVIVQSVKQKTHRFVVQDFKGLYLICTIFNGNMVFPTRLTRFIAFLAALNIKAVKLNSPEYPKISIVNESITPDFYDDNDKWLIGLTDAEGCFTVSLLPTNSFKIRYIVSQKWEANRVILEKILAFFNEKGGCTVGSIEKHSNTVANVYELRINGLSNCKNVIEYFDAHPLISKKLQSFIKWKELHGLLEKKYHLCSTKKQQLFILAKSINP